MGPRKRVSSYREYTLPLSSIDFHYTRDVEFGGIVEEMKHAPRRLLVVGIVIFHLSLTLGQPPGFVSIDCGSPEESYVDPPTNITFVSDAKLMQFGETKSVNSTYIGGKPKYVRHLRTFPNGKRNCYTLKQLDPGASKYLLRTSFLYGNFDGLGSFPQFDLYLEGTYALTVDASVSGWWFYEFIVKPSRGYVTLCLCKTNERDPFISAIELRPLPGDAIYPVVNSTLALESWKRYNFGDDKSYRYPVDVFDRFWWLEGNSAYDSIYPTVGLQSSNISTFESVSSNDNTYTPPSVVMQTALINPNASGGIRWSTTGITQVDGLFMCIHFAELKKLDPNETREFTVTLDSETLADAFRPLYLTATFLCLKNIHRSQSNLLRLTPTNLSTLSPIVNAMEVYRVMHLSGSATDDRDASTLVEIRDKYKINKAWTGDPCVPLNYPWERLVCSNDTLSPRVLSLDLSNSGLSGEIPESLANFTAIVKLNLSGNNLIGNIPVFLANLPELAILDLSDNDLSGCVPEDLLHKADSGRLTFRHLGNDKLGSSGPCTSHRKQFLKRVTIGTTVSAALLLVLVTCSIIIMKRKKRSPPGENPNLGSSKGTVDKGTTGCQVFSYSEVVEITNDFTQKIGEGGFGPVFLGRLQGQDVAVKVLSDKSRQGSKEFYTEVALLSRVHHRNLVSFLGYCDQAGKMILIYEYLSHGNLLQALSGRTQVSLAWNQRLLIALDAAQGLEYLHSGCKPAIIHRDVKSSNILLSDNLEAKLADFGVSKSGMPDGVSHISTAVVGTPGYLDPEYSMTNWLNEKSDVYSFGVVLLELISGQQHVIDDPSEGKIHVAEWARRHLVNGNHENVADPKLDGRYNVPSFWRVADTALECTADKGIKRPNMHSVVNELKESIVMCNTVWNSEISNSVTQQTSEASISSNNKPLVDEEIQVIHPPPR